MFSLLKSLVLYLGFAMNRAGSCPRVLFHTGFEPLNIIIVAWIDPHDIGKELYIT